MCARRTRVAYLPGLRVKVPKALQLLIFTCQRVNKHANVPKACNLFHLACQRVNVLKACQFFNLACQRAKRGTNFSTIFIKEKPYQPKTFDVDFNGARGINQTIIRLV